MVPFPGFLWRRAPGYRDAGVEYREVGPLGTARRPGSAHHRRAPPTSPIIPEHPAGAQRACGLGWFPGDPIPRDRGVSKLQSGSRLSLGHAHRVPPPSPSLVPSSRDSGTELCSVKRGVRVPAAAGSPLSASLSAIRSKGDSDARWAGTCLSSRRADAQAFRGSYLESVTYCAGGEKRAWLELAASVLAVHSRTFPPPMGERTHWRYRQAQGRCDVVRFSLGPTQGLACRSAGAVPSARCGLALRPPVEWTIERQRSSSEES